MWKEYNPNPKSRNIVGDCAVRALAKVLYVDWDIAYIKLCARGLTMGDMPSSIPVVGSVLWQADFEKNIIPDRCPDCYTVKDFCEEHPTGTYVLCTSNHIVAVEDGDYYDAWDSGDEVPVAFWEKA